MSYPANIKSAENLKISLKKSEGVGLNESWISLK